MVTKRELTDFILTEYPDMISEGTFNSRTADLYNGEIAIKFRPESGFKSLGDAIKGNSPEIDSVKVYGKTQLNIYKGLPLFSEFVGEELEKRGLDGRTNYFGDTISKRMPAEDALSSPDLIEAMASIIETQELFAEVYKKESAGISNRYQNSKKLFYSSKVL